MSEFKVCDICGEMIERYDTEYKSYKIKKRKYHYGLIAGWYHWSYIDVHTSCLKVLIQARDKRVDDLISKEEMRNTVIDEQ